MNSIGWNKVSYPQLAIYLQGTYTEGTRKLPAAYLQVPCSERCAVLTPRSALMIFYACRALAKLQGNELKMLRS